MLWNHLRYNIKLICSACRADGCTTYCTDGRTCKLCEKKRGAGKFDKYTRWDQGRRNSELICTVGWHKPSVTRPSTRKIIAVRLSNMVLVCPTAMVKGVPLLQLSSSHSYIRRRPSADHVHLTRGRFCVTCTHMAASARPQGST